MIYHYLKKNFSLEKISCKKDNGAYFIFKLTTLFSENLLLAYKIRAAWYNLTISKNTLYN